jgi:alpha-beta hydrolase superfamily lysophospholipase
MKPGNVTRCTRYMSHSEEWDGTFHEIHNEAEKAEVFKVLGGLARLTLSSLS